ncbi:DNA ligase 3 [Tribolium castaneum]|uniref:DNA ligase 3 n=1 Tax=Tribolium castaneum TaxID=7070 RepID=UPI0000D55502|nr:PREDICTED: DNA ligase 3 [Tribolium castaneum]|eukprot:XP_967954.1 PREDICTED: DNA ligase 3 [Tribolium castaneum]
MSDELVEKPFLVEVAKQGRAVCKKCKQKCAQGELRIAKLVANPFGEGKMKNWHHVNCLFEVFLKQRPTTKRIDDPVEDIDGWVLLDDEQKSDILKRVEECNSFFETKHGVKPSPKKTPQEAKPSTSSKDSSGPVIQFDPSHKDNQFREFRRVVADISNVSSYLEKTSIVSKMFTKGSDGTGFKGDIVLWCRLLLPGFVKRIYNLQSKQLVKLFSKIFHCDQDAMLEHLEQGDVSETIQVFYERSKSFKPVKKSTLTLQQVDEFLQDLTNLTKEEEQTAHLKTFASKCTANDLKIVIRLIKHDLRMNAGAKHILDGVHPDAYQAFQSSRDIKAVIDRCLKDKGTKARIELMTPVLPMLAEACKSVEQAMKKCPNGMYSEIKYDGERVQVHKQGSEFKYFSRSLKPVLPHKVAHFKNYIPQAFPHGTDLILDSEILMIDTQTGKPLPFGTLGIHKKSEFKDASVCLFVFDCIYYNGDVLTDKPISFRKKILKENMTEIPNHIVFSEMEEIHDPNDLTQMIAKVLKLGLEGLVLKDITSVYEPGKRHWLKVKKDYLFGGAMADSADLIVLGAWYGTGKKGGIMSIFLMGCYDEANDRFCTVSKVSTGHDDKTLEKLQTELDMVKISSDPAKVPDWLHCTKTMVPDFVARDPKKQPVWEITGAEFTKHEVHTADGISIRFPRVTKIRDDKCWQSATSLKELKVLFAKSKEHTDVSLLLQGTAESSPKKQKTLESFVKKRGSEDPQSSNSKKVKKEPKTVKIINPLPDYFHNIKVVLEDKVREKQWDLIRYFIAYGGQICKHGESENATHMIHLNSMVPEIDQCNPDVKHVTVDWIKNCVVNESVCDYRPFVVRWKPS